MAYYGNDKAINALVGRTIQKVWICEEENYLSFDTDQGIITWEAMGDCCSETWFADILGLNALRGQVVRRVEELPLTDYNTEDGRGRQEVDQVYGYKIVTDQGWTDIIFRNSSNGYYGGWIELLTGDRNMTTKEWWTGGKRWVDRPYRWTEIVGDEYVATGQGG